MGRTMSSAYEDPFGDDLRPEECVLYGYPPPRNGGSPSGISASALPSCREPLGTATPEQERLDQQAALTYET